MRDTFSKLFWKLLGWLQPGSGTYWGVRSPDAKLGPRPGRALRHLPHMFVGGAGAYRLRLKTSDGTVYT